MLSASLDTTTGCDRARASPETAGDTILIVLVADVLHQLVARLQRGRIRRRERAGVRAWVVDRHLVVEMPEIFARPAFDGVQLLGVRVTAAVEPELVVEADCSRGRQGHALSA